MAAIALWAEGVFEQARGFDQEALRAYLEGPRPVCMYGVAAGGRRDGRGAGVGEGEGEIKREREREKAKGRVKVDWGNLPSFDLGAGGWGRGDSVIKADEGKAGKRRDGFETVVGSNKILRWLVNGSAVA